MGYIYDMRCDCKKENEKKISKGVVISKIAVGLIGVLLEVGSGGGSTTSVVVVVSLTNVG